MSSVVIDSPLRLAAEINLPVRRLSEAVESDSTGSEARRTGRRGSSARLAGRLPVVVPTPRMALLALTKLLQVMTTARIIVCETSGRWAFALRSILVHAGVAVTETSGLATAFTLFRETPQSLLAFEATAACAEEGLVLLNASRRRNPSRGAVVFLDDTTAKTESLWYEAGAVAVIATPRDLAPLARFVRRCFDSRDKVPLTFRDSVWQRMPWSASELHS